MNREYFENFIEPVWLAFNQIHEDYKESLPRYRDSLLRGENPIEILHQINFDSSLTEDLRVRLEESMRNISSKKPAIKEKFVYNFASYILDYFDATYQTNQVNSKEIEEAQQTQNNQLTEKTRKVVIDNTGRVRVFYSIAEQLQNSGVVNNQEIYQEAKLAIENTLRRLQDCYRSAARGYSLVRYELLK